MYKVRYGALEDHAKGFIVLFSLMPWCGFWVCAYVYGLEDCGVGDSGMGSRDSRVVGWFSQDSWLRVGRLGLRAWDIRHEPSRFGFELSACKPSELA